MKPVEMCSLTDQGMCSHLEVILNMNVAGI